MVFTGGASSAVWIFKNSVTSVSKLTQVKDLIVTQDVTLTPLKCTVSLCEPSPQTLKLSGHAVQNWNFLRLLPLIIGDKVQVPQDNVWQLILQLKDIVDLICAQQISKAQVTYLDALIQEYLETRKALFPDINLRP